MKTLRPWIFVSASFDQAIDGVSAGDWLLI